MGAASRRKGVKGEQHVARVFRDAGHRVQTLQRNRSDMADVLVNGWLYVDSKNAEVWKIAEWLPAIERVTPEDSTPALALHRKGGRWWLLMPLETAVKMPL
jgi:hypothetical protein